MCIISKVVLFTIKKARVLKTHGLFLLAHESKGYRWSSLIGFFVQFAVPSLQISHAEVPGLALMFLALEIVFLV